MQKYLDLGYGTSLTGNVHLSFTFCISFVQVDYFETWNFIPDPFDLEMPVINSKWSRRNFMHRQTFLSLQTFAFLT